MVAHVGVSVVGLEAGWDTDSVAVGTGVDGFFVAVGTGVGATLVGSGVSVGAPMCGVEAGVCAAVGAVLGFSVGVAAGASATWKTGVDLEQAKKVIRMTRMGGRRILGTGVLFVGLTGATSIISSPPPGRLSPDGSEGNGLGSGCDRVGPPPPGPGSQTLHVGRRRS